MSAVRGECQISGCRKPAGTLPVILPETQITAYLCAAHRVEMLTPPAKRITPKER